MNFLLLLITVPLTAFAAVFAMFNTGDVTVTFIHDYTLPLSAVCLGLMGAGFFFGALFMWILGQKTRFKCWKETRRADRLEKELERLQAHGGKE